MLVLYVADVQCKYWMTDVKLTSLCNSHQCRLTLERLCSYRGRKKQFKATYLSWTSWLRKKDVSIAWKQTSDIKPAIKTVQPTLCPTTLWLTVCTVLSAGRSTSDFSAPIISLLHMTSHSASIMSMTECSVCGIKKNTHTLASHLLCGYLPVSDGEAHHGQTKTCWAEQLWSILISDRAALKESQWC